MQLLKLISYVCIGYLIQVSAFAQVDRDLLTRAERGDAEALARIAKSYRESKQYSKAVHYAKLAAEKNHWLGLEELGLLYRDGLGVDQSSSKACNYLEAAAQRSSEPYVRDNFSICYFEGGGRGTNWNEALKWVLPAAKAGFSPAMARAGFIYKQLKNPEQALFWTRQGIDAGETLAMMVLGEMYQEGFGVPENWVYTLYWYKLAADKGNIVAKEDLEKIFLSEKQSAEKGNIDSQYKMGVLLSRGYGTVLNLREALAWFEKGCAAKDVDSCVQAGIAYRDGSGTAKDLPRAASYFRMAAENGDSQGMVNLGWLYLNGQGVGKDLEQAFKLFSKAADANDGEGLSSLGWMYENGLSVARNVTKSIQYYRQASALGSAQADINLGALYGFGKNGITKDIQLAIKHFKLAGERGNLWGYTNLGDLYLSGTEVYADAIQGEKYLKLAADRGFGEAKLRLGHLYIRKSNIAGCRLVQEAYVSGATGYSARLLGWCELQGWQGRINAERGIRLLEEGAKLGDADAAFILAEQYESGHVVAKDAKQAMVYYTQAGNGGDKDAIHRLVRVFEKGELEQRKSPSEADVWRKKL